MCGRYRLTVSKTQLEEHYRAIASGLKPFEPSLNVTPGSEVPVVAVGREKIPVLTTFRWGLIPSWSKSEKTGYKMINARSETVTIKPSFSKPFQRSRCLIPCNGFYEWKGDGKEKKPWLIKRSDEEILSLAGLYDRWRSPAGEDLFTFTILTTKANRVMEKIHDRMPVILNPEEYSFWLGSGSGGKQLEELLRPFEDSLMTLQEGISPHSDPHPGSQ